MVATRLMGEFKLPLTCRRVVCIVLMYVSTAALVAACDDEPVPTAITQPTNTPAPVAVATSTSTSSATPTPTPTATVTATPTPEPTAAPTPEPTAVPTPEPTTTPEPLTSPQIFDKVSPSIAFIETAIGTGSGVLIGGGYVVTNAHVVWPFDAVRVVFPDGSEFHEVPLKGWDLLADLAVLGPIDPPVDTLDLVDGESLPIGTDVFLVGYPGEFEEFPQPTIGRGLLSRIREGESNGITYLQTDASVIGGQSGGAVVSNMGEVIGISGLAFTEGDFGIVASSTDILPRVRQIITGGDPSGLGDRRVPLEGGDLSHEVVLRNFWSQRIYVVNESSGTVIDFELNGNNDGALTAYDSLGTELLYLDDESTSAEFGSLVTEYDEPHFLIASQLSETPGDFTLTSNRRLIPLHDPDDGKQIQVGQSVQGNIDFPGDIDYLFVHLKEGETVEIVARSILVDTFLTISYTGAVDEQIIIDDDSGGGLFGLDSRIIYRAPHTGSYFLIVVDANLYAPGGYVITMNSAGPDATTTSMTQASLFRTPEVTSTTSTLSDFQLTELRSAFAGLPASFEEVEPADLGLSIEALGLKYYFSNLVVFFNPDPFQMIMAGQISESERKAIDLTRHESGRRMQGFLSVGSGGQEGIEIHDSGLLDSSTVGANSFGAYLELTTEGTRLRMEFIMFRRGNLVGVVYSYSLPGTQPSVSVQGAAKMLDAKMLSYWRGSSHCEAVTIHRNGHL